MTNQEVFDKVAAHLLAQGVRSVSITHKCLYRGPKGLKCAIGCLIPNHKYGAELEGQSVSFMEVQLAAGLDANQFDLASSLQGVHDCCVPSKWDAELRGVAQRFDLVCNF